MQFAMQGDEKSYTLRQLQLDLLCVGNARFQLLLLLSCDSAESQALWIV